MDQLTLRSDNISYQDQDSLVDKLLISTHPAVNDDNIKSAIEIEIERRKNNGLWLINNNK